MRMLSSHYDLHKRLCLAMHLRLSIPQKCLLRKIDTIYWRFVSWRIFFWLIFSDSSGFIRLWDCFDGSPHPKMVFEIFENSVPCDFNRVEADDIVPNELLCLALSLDASRFVTGGVDTIIKVYDLRTRTRMIDLISGYVISCFTTNGCRSRSSQKNECTHHSNRVTALVYHPRGDTDANYSHIFISASWDKTIQIWDDRCEASLW